MRLALDMTRGAGYTAAAETIRTVLMTFPWLCTLAVLAALAAPVGAEAHAILIRSDPAIGGSVPAGQVKIWLRYNSRIDRGRSRLTLTGPDQTQAILPIGPDLDGYDDSLTTTADLPHGDYVLRWQVLAVDGHITRGDVPFTVSGP
jgi:methionine-rich copper-binding protein CopC